LSSVSAARGQFQGKVGSNRECRCRLVTEDGVEKGAKAPSYDDWSVPDLRDKARQVGIKGRSSMSKKELVPRCAITEPASLGRDRRSFGIVPDNPADRLSNLLGALSLALADQIREVTERAAGVSDAAPAALVSLRESPSERTIEDLRTLVGLTHSGGVRLVDRLAELGYVTRRSRPPGRSVVVTLTQQGADAADRIALARAEVLGRAIRSLSPDEQDLLATSLSTMIGDIARDRLARRADGRPPRGGALCRMCDFTACGREFARCPAQTAAAAVPHPG